MKDLYIAWIGLLLGSVAAFGGAWWCAGRINQTLRWLPALFLVAAILVFDLWFRDSIQMIRLLPVSSLPVLGNWLLPLCAALAGCLWRVGKIPGWRRLIFALLLLGFGACRPAAALVRRPSACTNIWRGGVCLQSNSSNCGAAAAATLLKAYSIATHETEMVELCLTDRDGTSLHGMYRGLRLKADGKGLAVRAKYLSPPSLPDEKLLPAILMVRLSAEVDEREPRYSREWGWIRGVKHAVVLFRVRPDGKAEVGDPSFGRETWDVQSLHDLWTGEFLTLEAR